MFGSIRRLPRFTRYAEAKAHYDKVKPIRGSDNIRPLTARRDKQMTIRESARGIECVLHETPVITYLPDDTISIQNGSWGTNLTNQFIMGMLPSVWVSNKLDKTIICLGSQENGYILSATPLVVKQLPISNGFVWQVVEAQGIWEWRLNRKQANNVRSKYSSSSSFTKGSCR